MSEVIGKYASATKLRTVFTAHCPSCKINSEFQQEEAPRKVGLGLLCDRCERPMTLVTVEGREVAK